MILLQDEEGEKEREVLIRHLSRYSMTSNNSQKLPTTDRVIKSKQPH